MIRHILVPTDLSSPAAEAFRYAQALAAQLGASIDLLYVDTATPCALPSLNEALLLGDLAAAREKLAAHYANSDSPVAIRAHIVSGAAGAHILAQSMLLKSDMIVMGHSGETPSEEMGSVTQEVIAQAEVPVMAIPEQCSYRPIRHMIYASNFEHLDPEDSEQLLEMARLLHARLSCLHVETQPQPWATSHESLFEVVYEQAQGQQVVQFFYTQSDDTSRGICDFVQEQGGDLLIMMRRQRPAAGLSDSLTSQMAQISQVPLLALHEKRRGI